MKRAKHPPIHPGRFLKLEFLEPLELSQNQLAKDISVSPRLISEIVHGKRSISADTALRLSKYFKLDEDFWLAIQNQYILDVAKDELADRLDREVKIYHKKTA